jgi:hypothetical protein
VIYRNYQDIEYKMEIIIECLGLLIKKKFSFPNFIRMGSAGYSHGAGRVLTPPSPSYIKKVNDPRSSPMR